MTALSFLCVLITELCSVAGQIFFKHATNQGEEGTRAKVFALFFSGIAVKAVAFFLWLGLLSKFELSYLYPFDGLSPILLVAAAFVFLKEKLTPSLCVGALLISAGVALVSAS